MKKIFILISLMICLSQLSFSQITWCPAGATWHNIYGSIGGYGGYVETKYVSDTMVSGINCKKLIEHIRYRHFFGGPETNTYSSLFTYESSGVIFMFNLVSGSNNWDTLYNFNTAVNNNWHLNSTDTVLIKVYGAGTKIINGDTLQWRAINFVFPDYLTGLAYDTLYERIGLTGSDFGFIYPEINYGPNEPSIHNLCNYYDSSFAIYGNPDTVCTQIPSEINDLNEFDNAINIYQNPGSDFINVSSAATIQSIKIYDVFGRLVFNSTERKNLFQLNTQHFADGIYFIQVSILNKAISVKWVKTDS